MGTGLVALLLAGCSSSSSSSTTTKPTASTTTTVAATSTTGAAATTGAASAQDLATAFVTAVAGSSPASFCTTHAVPGQVSSCTSAAAGSGTTFKGWAVGDVTFQGDQAVITYTGTVCQGGQCISNSDPEAATNPSSAVYAGATSAAAFATADDPNSQNSSPFVAAGVQQSGRWYASGF